MQYVEPSLNLVVSCAAPSVVEVPYPAGPERPSGIGAIPTRIATEFTSLSPDLSCLSDKKLFLFEE